MLTELTRGRAGGKTTEDSILPGGEKLDCHSFPLEKWLGLKERTCWLDLFSQGVFDADRTKFQAPTCRSNWVVISLLWQYLYSKGPIFVP